MHEDVLSYAPVGATRPADFPEGAPSGCRAYQHRVAIGFGAETFSAAGEMMLAWGIQRRSGMRVEVPTAGGAWREATAADRVAEGTIARLRIPLGPFRVGAPCRVVYVIEDERVLGFAYGTLPGHPESGEAAFLVELAPEGSVHLMLRAFSRPSNWFYRLGTPLLRAAQWWYVRRYLKALKR